MSLHALINWFIHSYFPEYFVPIPATASVDPLASAAVQHQANSALQSDAMSRAAATKPQKAKASSRWDVEAAFPRQQQAKALPRWDYLAGHQPASMFKLPSHSAQNLVRKRNRGDDRSGNFGDRDVGARPRHDYDRKWNRGNDGSGNSSDRDAGPYQKNGNNRKQTKDKDWARNRGRPQTMQDQGMYSSGQHFHQQNFMQGHSKSYSLSGGTNDSRDLVQAQPRIPVQNFNPQSGMRPDNNQFGTSWQENRDNAYTGQDPCHFPLHVPKQHSPNMEGPANKFHGDRRSQSDYSMQGSRFDQRDDRIFHDTRNSVHAAANSGVPTFSNMDEKLQALLSLASTVESVGPAVEAIITAARQLGANSREALALFADNDHATILSVYFNTLEERATYLAGTDQFLIYQRAVAFGRAFLNMAKQHTMK